MTIARAGAASLFNGNPAATLRVGAAPSASREPESNEGQQADGVVCTQLLSPASSTPDDPAESSSAGSNLDRTAHHGSCPKQETLDLLGQKTIPDPNDRHTDATTQRVALRLCVLGGETAAVHTTT